MLNAMRRSKERRALAARLYAALVARARDPVFFARFAVKDTLDGRFDLVVLHAWLVLERLNAAGAASLSQAFVDTVFIGFESMNPESLKEMKKRQNLEDIREATRIVQAAGIHIHGMFVFGFEEDDWETVEATVRFARNMKLTSVQLLILTPLPGSELYHGLRTQGRITSFNWDLYDTHHVAYRPAHFTPFELQCAQVYGHTQLYALPEAIKKLVTGRFVAAGLSFYAWKINREWQKGNQSYLRDLAINSGAAGVSAARASGRASRAEAGWIDASRRPAPFSLVPAALHS